MQTREKMMNSVSTFDNDDNHHNTEHKVVTANMQFVKPRQNLVQIQANNFFVHVPHTVTVEQQKPGMFAGMYNWMFGDDANDHQALKKSTTTTIADHKDEQDIAKPETMPTILFNDESMSIASNLITQTCKHLTHEIFAHLPVRARHAKWQLLYCSQTQGTSLQTFHKCAQDAQDTIVLVQTMQGNVIGCFASEAWHLDSKYYGNGETMVFAATNHEQVHLYKWSKQNTYFLFSNGQRIAIGEGAIVLDKDLSTGFLRSCTTFGLAEPLLSREPDFEILSVELYALLT